MKMKKLAVLALAAVMAMGMATTAMAQSQTVGDAAGGDKATITVSNASKGVEYSLYKIFDATYDPVTGSIAYTSDKLAAEDCPFVVNDKNQIVLKAGYTLENSADLENPNAVVEWIKSNAVKVNTEAIIATDDTLIFQGLEYGYYYVESGLGGFISVDSTNPNATVIDKNATAPTPDGDWKVVNDTNVSVGDSVDYTVAFYTVNYVATEKVETYTIEDTPSNVKIDTESLVVKAGDTVLYDGNVNHLNSSSVIAADKLKIVIDWVNEDRDPIYDNNTKIEVTYSGEVLAAAADNGASNKATVYYNKTTAGEKETKSVTYDFTLTKTDDKRNMLDGAEFQLMRGEDLVYVVAETDKDNNIIAYHVADSTEDDVKTDTIVVNSKTLAGAITIKGLELSEDYTLVETKAPDGYNMLTGAVVINTNKTDDAKATDYVDQTVVNNTGTELPSTGGIGTTIFYVIGGILVLGAGVVLVAKKRMRREA